MNFLPFSRIYHYRMAIALLFILTWGYGSAVAAKTYEPVQWVELIPKSDLDALLNPPQSIMNIAEGSSLDVIPSETDPLADSIEQAINDSINGSVERIIAPEEQAYYDALKSTKINAELNQKNIRIPGFIVPVEYNDQQVITEFFLVPYFGACIHVPPPPPNQIIYVKYPKGLSLDVLYDPYWIEGQLLTEIVENDLALSAYTMNAAGVKTYDKYKP